MLFSKQDKQEKMNTTDFVDVNSKRYKKRRNGILVVDNDQSFNNLLQKQMQLSA